MSMRMDQVLNDSLERKKYIAAHGMTGYLFYPLKYYYDL